MGVVLGVYGNWIWEFGDHKSNTPILFCSIWPNTIISNPIFFFGKWTKWVYPPLFQTKVGGGKMQTSSPPVITPNRSQSNPDDMITLPRPIQSVAMDLHDVSGTSTGQTLPRERRAPPGTQSDNWVGIPTICYYFYPPPTIVHFFIHFCPKYTHL